MSIGAMTANAGGTPTFHQPVFMDLLSFAGDASYPTGGTPGFQALVRTALGRGNLEVIAVIPQDCGGVTVSYEKATDKLKCFAAGNPVTPALTSPNATDLASSETLANEVKTKWNAAAGTPVALGVEPPATTNLSGTTFNVLVISK